MNQLLSRCAEGSIDSALTEKPLTPLSWVTTTTSVDAEKIKRRDELILLHYEQAFKPTFHDVMTFFWQNHFGADYDSIIEPNWCWQYYTCLRKNAMGNFRTFVREITLNSGMMERLNVNGSVKGNPNKNFARELLELFTLGVGNYTEQDVDMLAMGMTGFYSLYTSTTTSVVEVDPKIHDYSAKQLSSFFGNTILPARTATIANAFAEVDDFINVIFRTQPQTVAKFICRKLYRYFIFRELDDAFVAQMCDVLIANNWELKPLLRFMLTSAHFNDPKFQGSIIKSPVELVAGVIRDFNVKWPVTYKKECLYKLRVRLMNMKHDLGNPVSIAGWPAYRGPDYDEGWYNGSSGTERARLLEDLFDPWKFSLNGEGFWVDPLVTVRTFTTPSNPNAVVDQALDKVQRTFTAAEKQSIKSQYLLNGGTNDAFWTNAYNGYLAGNAANRQTVKDNLTRLFRFVILHRSYQTK